MYQTYTAQLTRIVSKWKFRSDSMGMFLKEEIYAHIHNARRSISTMAGLAILRTMIMNDV